MTSIRHLARRMPALAVGLFLASIVILTLSCSNPLGRYSQSGKGSLAIKVRLPAFPRGSSIASNVSSRFLTPQTVSMSAQLLQNGEIVRDTSAEPDAEGTFTLAFAEVPVGTYRLNVSASDGSGVYATSSTDIQVNAGNNQQAIVLLPDEPHELDPGNNGGLTIEAGSTGIYSFAAPYAGTWTINLSGAPSDILVFGNDGRRLASYTGGSRISLPAMVEGEHAYIAVYAGESARTISAAAVRSPTSSVNPAFGAGGMGAVLGAVSDSTDVIEDMVELPDGRIATAGTSTSDDQATTNHAFVAVFNPDGATLDKTFGDDGRIFIEISGSTTEAFSCALQDYLDTTYLIIAGREKATSGPYSYFLTRIDLNGERIDPNFGFEGFYSHITTFSSVSRCSPPDCAVDVNDRILVCMNSIDNDSPYPSIVRLSPGGQPDTDFAGDSRAESTQSAYPVAIAISSSQDIFIAGHNAANTSWYVSKLNQDGAGSAMTYGTANFFGANSDTRIIAPPNSSGASLADIAFSQTGMIETLYLAGNAQISSTYQMALSAINPATGEKRYPGGIFAVGDCWTARLDIDNRATSLAFDAIGNIMLGGFANNGTDQFGIAVKIRRDTTSPSLDTAFNNEEDGEYRNLSAYEFNNLNYVEKIAKTIYRDSQPANFLFGGRTACGKSGSAIFDLLLLGHDASDGGRLSSSHTPLQYQKVSFNASACLEDGSVIAVGAMGFQAIVAKLAPDGSLAAGFADKGIRIFEGSSSDPSRFNVVAIAPDGQIIAAGRSIGGFSYAVSLDPNTGQQTLRWGNGTLRGEQATGEIFSIAIIDNDAILFGERFNLNSSAVYQPRILVSRTTSGTFSAKNVDVGNSTVETTRTSGLAFDPDANRLYAAVEIENASHLFCYPWNGGILDNALWNAELSRFGGGGSNHSPSVILDIDGSVFALWRNHFDDAHTPCIQRFLPSGVPDPMRTFNVSNMAGYDYRGVIHPDGRIYVAGTQASAGSLPLRGFVSMLNPENPADTGFGDAGTGFFSDPSNEYSGFSGISLNAEGDLVMPGFAQRNGSRQGIVVTYR